MSYGQKASRSFIWSDFGTHIRQPKPNHWPGSPASRDRATSRRPPVPRPQTWAPSYWSGTEYDVDIGDDPENTVKLVLERDKINDMENQIKNKLTKRLAVMAVLTNVPKLLPNRIWNFKQWDFRTIILILHIGVDHQRHWHDLLRGSGGLHRFTTKRKDDCLLIAVHTPIIFENLCDWWLLKRMTNFQHII